jgi:HEAT repeat protein
LARALYRRERLSVLKLARIAMDHCVTPLHDHLLNAGAGAILLLCLERAMASSNVYWPEVDGVLQLIGFTFRSSDDTVAKALVSNGRDLVIVLFSILSHETASNECYCTARALIGRIASVELCFPSVKQSGELLCFLLQMIPCNDKVLLLEAMRLLAGFTRHAESKIYFMQCPAFLSAVISCSHAGTGKEAKLEVARILQNLSAHGSNKMKMIQDQIVEQLVALASPKELSTTREQAIAAMRNISVEAKGKLFLATFKGGVVLQRLLQASDERNLQLVVVETLVNVVCHSTASLISNEHGIVQKLANLASTEIDPVSEKAAQTIKRLATHIPVSHRGHPGLFSTMLSLSTAKHWRVRHWIAKAFLEQSRLSGSSFVLVRSPEALEKLAELADDKYIDIRTSAVEALLVLTVSDSNLRRLTGNKRLLDTFVKAVERSIDGSEEERQIGRNAILAILNLTDNRSARKRAAKHTGILSVLSRYGISNDSDDELKRAALHGVILLAPLL